MPAAPCLPFPPLPGQRVDIDGGGVVVFDRDPITGPPGVLLCGGGGGAEVVVRGADVGCGRLGAFEEGGADDVDVEEAARESLMAPPLGRSPGEDPSCIIGAPLGRSAPAPVALEEAAALLVSCPGG